METTKQLLKEILKKLDSIEKELKSGKEIKENNTIYGLS